MLYDAIRVGSDVFHERVEPRGSGSYYDRYFGNCSASLIDDPGALDLQRAEWLIDFVNHWRTRCPTEPKELLPALQDVLPALRALRHESILSIELDKTCAGSSRVSDLIATVFEIIADCGPRYESTGASKILHMIHPELFVMWDQRIAYGYAVGDDRNGDDYVKQFLPRVQLVLRRAIAVRKSTGELGTEQQAARGLCGCGHTLAKIVDEYNYAKYTLRDRRVWETEYSN